VPLAQQAALAQLAAQQAALAQLAPERVVAARRAAVAPAAALQRVEPLVALALVVSLSLR